MSLQCYRTATIAYYWISTVMLAQVAIDETGKRQYDEKTSSDSEEFPMLREDVSNTGLKKIADATECSIQNYQFQKAEGKGFGWP